VPDFSEQIEAETNHRLIVTPFRHGGSRFCACVAKDFIALPVKKKAVSVDRYPLAAKTNEVPSSSKTRVDVATILERLSLRAINQNQSGIVLRNRPVCANQDIVIDAGSVKVPRSFEQLEEFSNNRILGFTGNNTDHFPAQLVNGIQ
jgi:hypothetical protein